MYTTTRTSRLLLPSLLLLASSAQATLVTTSFEGTVTLDNSGVNPFGLSINDTIYGSVTYDDADIAGTSANEEQTLVGRPNWGFSITLGSYTFGQSQVTDPGYTRIWFNLGVVDGLKFYLEPINFGTYGDQTIEDYGQSRSLYVEAFPSNTPALLEATWDFTTNTTSPVNAPQPPTPNPNPNPLPIPASWLLLLAGVFAAVRQRCCHT